MQIKTALIASAPFHSSLSLSPVIQTHRSVLTPAYVMLFTWLILSGAFCGPLLLDIIAQSVLDCD